MDPPRRESSAKLGPRTPGTRRRTGAHRPGPGARLASKYTPPAKATGSGEAPRNHEAEHAPGKWNEEEPSINSVPSRHCMLELRVWGPAGGINHAARSRIPQTTSEREAVEGSLGGGTGARAVASRARHSAGVLLLAGWCPPTAGRTAFPPPPFAMPSRLPARCSVFASRLMLADRNGALNGVGGSSSLCGCAFACAG